MNALSYYKIMKHDIGLSDGYINNEYEKDVCIERQEAILGCFN